MTSSWSLESATSGPSASSPLHMIVVVTQFGRGVSVPPPRWPVGTNSSAIQVFFQHSLLRIAGCTEIRDGLVFFQERAPCLDAVPRKHDNELIVGTIMRLAGNEYLVGDPVDCGRNTQGTSSPGPYEALALTPPAYVLRPHILYTLLAEPSPDAVVTTGRYYDQEAESHASG